MKYHRLQQFPGLLFTSSDLAQAMGIQRSSARVFCSRYVAQGLLIRLKRDLYIRSEDWSRLATTDLYQIANRLQVPSYISLTSALSYHEVTTQVQPGYLESITQNRTVRYEVKGIILSYTRVQQTLYFGFQRVDGIFMASPEKALLDAMYLQYLGRYSLDIAALDLDKIRRNECAWLQKAFPNYIGKGIKDLWKA